MWHLMFSVGSVPYSLYVPFVITEPWKLKSKHSNKAIDDGRLRPRVSIFSGAIWRYLAHYVKTWRYPQNRKCIEKYRTTAKVTCRPTEIFVKLGYVVFEVCERTDRQTDRHADTLIAVLRYHTGDDVITTQLITVQSCRIYVRQLSKLSRIVWLTWHVFLLLKDAMFMLQILVLERPRIPSDRALSPGRLREADTCPQQYWRLLAESDDRCGQVSNSTVD